MPVVPPFFSDHFPRTLAPTAIFAAFVTLCAPFAAPAQDTSVIAPPLASDADEAARMRANAQDLGLVESSARSNNTPTPPPESAAPARTTRPSTSRTQAPRSNAQAQRPRPSTSSRPNRPKPTPPPVIGGVYYPPSSPVYEANGYTWGYQPGRYSPGRYTPGRYTPGRYRPGRYNPPGAVAEAIFDERPHGSTRPSRSSRPVLDSRHRYPEPTPTGFWDEPRHQYGQFRPFPGNGGFIVIQPSPVIIHQRWDRGW
jgi:hypothetical protein